MRILSRSARLNSLVYLGLYAYNSIAISRIASSIVKFGRAFGADTLWCALQGPSLIRLALPVARGLGIPLLTEVFDPPIWELREYSADRLSTTLLLREFGEAIRSSRACATASLPMANEYEREYGVKTVAILPSLDAGLALPPAQEVHPGRELIIGLAGQMYATEEWKALISALDTVGWQIGGRNVRIRVLGRWFRFGFDVNKPMCIEYLGWHTQENAVRLLSEADILYCPYWFSPAFEVEARLSFPSKLPTYLAAGRPVLFHGPEYASAAGFLKDNAAGFLCNSNSPSVIINALLALATDTNLYARLTKNGRTAFDKYFTLSSLRQSFATFLGAKEDFLLPVEDSPKVMS